MCLSLSLAQNARVARKLINEAVAAKAKVLFLPEAADYISRDATHSVELANGSRSHFLETVQNAVRTVYNQAAGSDPDRGIFVAVGIHEPASGANFGKKVQNNQVWIANTGDVVQRYQKIHLFDVNIANGPILQESNSVEAGNKIEDPVPIGLLPFRVGLAICYDIRFGEMATVLRQKGANIITYPLAFTTKTGEAHWLELGRARAIDSQCYVVMAAQCGRHNVYADSEEHGSKKRESYGQSVIIGPWGNVIAKGTTYLERGVPDEDGDYLELVVGDLETGPLERIRKELPVFSHRRPEVYK